MADRFLSFGIDNMTCGSCERRIGRAAVGLDGVRNTKESAVLGEVEVRFDPGLVAAAAIADAIAMDESSPSKGRTSSGKGHAGSV